MNDTSITTGTIEFLERVRRFGKRKPQTKYQVIEKLKVDVQRVLINGKSYVLKYSNERRGLAGVAASRMYNEIGIQTPKIELVNSDKDRSIRSIQDDVSKINGLEVILANEQLDYLQIEKNLVGNDKWRIFYDQNLESVFLEFMTYDCLEQLKSMYLVDELRTERDRWLENFYLYKGPESRKYEGVIAIDLDEMAIMYLCGVSKKDFERFLDIEYNSTNPQQTFDYKCYRERVRGVLELACDGVLSDANILVVKNALGFDFPKELEKLCDIKRVSPAERLKILEPIKRLWDYNNKILGREFEL